MSKMTSYEPPSLQKDPSTVVEVNWEEFTAVIVDPTKFTTKFHCFKLADNNRFFGVRNDKRQEEGSFLGSFTTLEQAIQATCIYIRNSKQSQASKNEELAEARKKRNAAKTQPKGSELL